VALILTVDPGGNQAAALGRLARELPGHELVAANSCAVAITFIDHRVPDLVLLPPLLPETESAALLSRLRTLPQPVPTLTIPLLTDTAPVPGKKPSRKRGQPAAETEAVAGEGASLYAFARQIREFLDTAPAITVFEGPPPAEAASPTADAHAVYHAHLLAAANAAVSWVRMRRESWAAAPAPWVAEQVYAAVPVNAAPVAQSAAAPSWDVTAPAEPLDMPAPPAQPRGPSFGSRVADVLRSWQEPIARWLPRLALLAIVVALVAAGRNYWPTVRTTLTTGVAVFESVPPGSSVLVDGQELGTTPLETRLSTGRHTVEFRDGDASRTVEIVVSRRVPLVETVDWAAAPTGILQVSSDPAGAQVLVDGEPRGTTPLTLDGLAVGRHDVALESPAGSVRRQITIAANETTRMDELIFSSWLTVYSPFEVEISEGNRVISLDERDQVMLPPGSHELRFQNRTLGYNEVRRVELEPARTTTVSLVPPQTTISITATEPADVWIDGQRVGSTPLSNASIPLGTREVVLRTASGDERRRFVTATVQPVQINVDFSTP